MKKMIASLLTLALFLSFATVSVSAASGASITVENGRVIVTVNGSRTEIVTNCRSLAFSTLANGETIIVMSGRPDDATLSLNLGNAFGENLLVNGAFDEVNFSEDFNSDLKIAIGKDANLGKLNIVSKNDVEIFGQVEDMTMTDKSKLKVNRGASVGTLNGSVYWGLTYKVQEGSLITFVKDLKESIVGAGLVYRVDSLKSLNAYISQSAEVLENLDTSWDSLKGSVSAPEAHYDTWHDTGKQTYYTGAAGDTLLVSDALDNSIAIGDSIVGGGDNSVAIGGGNVGGDIIASVDENADSGLETAAGKEYLDSIREQLKYDTAYANYSMLSDNKTIQVNITNDKVKVSDAVKDNEFLRKFFFVNGVREVVVKNGKGLFMDETINDLNVGPSSDNTIVARFDSIASIIAKAAGIDLAKNPNATLAELCGHSVDVRVHGVGTDMSTGEDVGAFVKNLTFRFVNVTPPPTIPPVDETVDDNPN